MRHATFAFACCLLFSSSALGAAGDPLVVTGNDVNVRTGPGLDHDVIRQVDRAQRVIEIARDGDWVHAEIEGSEGAEGWIHGSLLTPGDQPDTTAPEDPEPAAPPPPEAQPESADPPAISPDAPLEPATEAIIDDGAQAATTPEAPAPAAASEIAPVDLQRFRDSVDYLNSRALAVAGVDLFAEVEPVGGGAVQVRATDGWANIPPAGQLSYANTLLDRWAAATGGAGPVKVQIVDDSGEVILEESRP